VVLHAEPQMQLITPGTQQKRMVGSLGGRQEGARCGGQSTATANRLRSEPACAQS
jgi:hypothetical protein